MQFTKVLGIGAASLLALNLMAERPAAAQIINGGFEAPDAGSGFVIYGPGTPTGFGWTIAGGTIDHKGGYWLAAEGSQSLDLTGYSSGSIYQDVVTTAGQSYLLEFAMAGNPGGDTPIREMEVFWGSTSLGIFSFDTTGHTLTSMGWEQRSAPVVGTGLDRLTFTTVSTTVPNWYGPALDDVRLTATPASAPEPGTMALLATGVFGLARKLRRRREEA